MEKIVFGGAVLSMIVVFSVFVVSLGLFIWKLLTEEYHRLKGDFIKGYNDGMGSE